MYINILKKNKGFTMLEMLVVLAIIAILGSIFLSAGFGRTRARNALITDTQDISSLVTEMQNKTTSFEENKSYINNVGYGIYIDTTNKNKIESFYKINSNDFDGTDLLSGKPVDDIILTNPNIINRICINSCDSFTASSSLKIVSYFIKPKQYTHFAISQDGITYTNKISTQDINNICIEISSPSYQDYRHIDIKYIGQVSSSYGPCQ